MSAGAARAIIVSLFAHCQQPGMESERINGRGTLAGLCEARPTFYEVLLGYTPGLTQAVPALTMHSLCPHSLCTCALFSLRAVCTV